LIIDIDVLIYGHSNNIVLFVCGSQHDAKRGRRKCEVRRVGTVCLPLP